MQNNNRMIDRRKISDMVCSIISAGVILTLSSVVMMKIIERNSVEGWQDDRGFHLGRYDGVDGGDLLS